MNSTAKVPAFRYVGPSSGLMPALIAAAAVLAAARATTLTAPRS